MAQQQHDMPDNTTPARRGRKPKTEQPDAPTKLQMNATTHIARRPKAGPVVTVYIAEERDGYIIAKRDAVYENGQLVKAGKYWEGTKANFEREFVKMTDAQQKEDNG